MATLMQKHRSHNNIVPCHRRCFNAIRELKLKRTISVGFTYTPTQKTKCLLGRCISKTNRNSPYEKRATFVEFLETLG